MKVSRTFWSSDTKSAPANLWFTLLSLPPGPSPGSRCRVRQSSTPRRCALLRLPPERLLQPSRAQQRKGFLVISLNFPSLAFITSLMSSNPLARSCSVKCPHKPTSSTSPGLISSPAPPPCLSSLPTSLDKPCPGVFGVIQPCFPKPCPGSSEVTPRICWSFKALGSRSSKLHSRGSWVARIPRLFIMLSTLISCK